MAVYTTSAAVIDLIGQLGLDLRTDDEVEADMLTAAIAYASGRIDFYCLQRVSATELAASQWVKDVATFLAIRWLCQRRLNEVPSSIAEEWEERKEELQLVQQGKAMVPGATVSRRPVTVTNQTVDLRKFDHQLRVDRSRSSGVANGYPRRTDRGAEQLGEN